MSRHHTASKDDPSTSAIAQQAVRNFTNKILYQFEHYNLDAYWVNVIANQTKDDTRPRGMTHAQFVDCIVQGVAAHKLLQLEVDYRGQSLISHVNRPFCTQHDSPDVFVKKSVATFTSKALAALAKVDRYHVANITDHTAKAPNRPLSVPHDELVERIVTSMKQHEQLTYEASPNPYFVLAKPNAASSGTVQARPTMLSSLPGAAAKAARPPDGGGVWGKGGPPSLHAGAPSTAPVRPNGQRSRAVANALSGKSFPSDDPDSSDSDDDDATPEDEDAATALVQDAVQLFTAKALSLLDKLPVYWVDVLAKWTQDNVSLPRGITHEQFVDRVVQGVASHDELQLAVDDRGKAYIRRIDRPYDHVDDVAPPLPFKGPTTARAVDMFVAEAVTTFTAYALKALTKIERYHVSNIVGQTAKAPNRPRGVPHDELVDLIVMGVQQHEQLTYEASPTPCFVLTKPRLTQASSSSMGPSPSKPPPSSPPVLVVRANKSGESITWDSDQGGSQRPSDTAQTLDGIWGQRATATASPPLPTQWPTPASTSPTLVRLSPVGCLSGDAVSPEEPPPWLNGDDAAASAAVHAAVEMFTVKVLKVLEQYPVYWVDVIAKQTQEKIDSLPRGMTHAQYVHRVVQGVTAHHQLQLQVDERGKVLISRLDRPYCSPDEQAQNVIAAPPLPSSTSPPPPYPVHLTPSTSAADEFVAEAIATFSGYALQALVKLERYHVSNIEGQIAKAKNRPSGVSHEALISRIVDGMTRDGQLMYVKFPAPSFVLTKAANSTALESPASHDPDMQYAHVADEGGADGASEASPDTPRYPEDKDITSVTGSSLPSALRDVTPIPAATHQTSSWPNDIWSVTMDTSERLLPLDRGKPPSPPPGMARLTTDDSSSRGRSDSESDSESVEVTSSQQQQPPPEPWTRKTVHELTGTRLEQIVQGDGVDGSWLVWLYRGNVNGDGDNVVTVLHVVALALASTDLSVGTIDLDHYSHSVTSTFANGCSLVLIAHGQVLPAFPGHAITLDDVDLIVEYAMRGLDYVLRGLNSSVQGKPLAADDNASISSSSNSSDYSSDDLASDKESVGDSNRNHDSDDDEDYVDDGSQVDGGDRASTPTNHQPMSEVLPVNPSQDFVQMEADKFTFSALRWLATNKGNPYHVADIIGRTKVSPIPGVSTSALVECIVDRMKLDPRLIYTLDDQRRRVFFLNKQHPNTTANQQSPNPSASKTVAPLEKPTLPLSQALPSSSTERPTSSTPTCKLLVTGEKVIVANTVHQLTQLLASDTAFQVGGKAMIAIDWKGAPSTLHLVGLATQTATYVVDCVAIGAATVMQLLGPVLHSPAITKVCFNLHAIHAILPNVHVLGSFDMQLYMEFQTGSLDMGLDTMLDTLPGGSLHPSTNSDLAQQTRKKPSPVECAAYDVVRLLDRYTTHVADELAIMSWCAVQTASDTRLRSAARFKTDQRILAMDTANRHKLVSFELLMTTHPFNVFQFPDLITHQELEPLLSLLPTDLVRPLRAMTTALSSIVLDVGRRPWAWNQGGTRVMLSEDPSREVSAAELEAIVAKVGGLEGPANRARGVDKQLHRISGLRNRHHEIVGVTMQVGQHVYGASTLLLDLLLSTDLNILFLGESGSGKTTILRDVARVVSETRHVCIVDTTNDIAGEKSNPMQSHPPNHIICICCECNTYSSQTLSISVESLGDGDVPHPSVGLARRVMVPSLEAQGAVMADVVRNHRPQVLVVDELGRSGSDIDAARTCKQRGVRIVASMAYGGLRQLVQDKGLVEGVRDRVSSTLGGGDRLQKGGAADEAVFDVVVELDKGHWNEWRVVTSVASAVDDIAAGNLYKAHVRSRLDQNGIRYHTVMV
ncbi:hypothetical protein DYB38_001764 [Aphanomyces astaci]|uniref:AAA+ ATPase domain-containing protein n=2 Tax=Aphanomyces astaci TaxID=112090 RepID=A0A397D1W8_APHAT|nr:hypothetical protein DYB38_001764 [Aphanomyces astaci]